MLTRDLFVVAKSCVLRIRSDKKIVFITYIQRIWQLCPSSGTTVLYNHTKTGLSGRHFSKCRPTWMKFGNGSVVAWNTLVDSILSRSAHRRRRLQAKRFAILKCTRTPVIYNGSARCRWKTQKCVRSGLYCPEKNAEVSNEAGASQQTAEFRYSCAHSLYESFTANQWYGNYPDIKNPNGETQTPKNRISEIYLMHPTDVENGEIFFFQIRPKWHW